MIENSTVILFSRNGLGDAPEGLQQVLVVKYLNLLWETHALPGAILFYTEGVRLVCEGSPVIERLREYQNAGVTLIVCSTCLDFFELRDKVRVGEVLGMPQIIAAMQVASKVISL